MARNILSRPTNKPAPKMGDHSLTELLCLMVSINVVNATNTKLFFFNLTYSYFSHRAFIRVNITTLTPPANYLKMEAITWYHCAANIE